MISTNLFGWAWLRERAENIRVHGNGFLQIDVGPGQRVHIFGHPAIPRQSNPTPIHNHRFGFQSTVLLGTLVNVPYLFLPGSIMATHAACTYEPSGPDTEDTRLCPTQEAGRVVPGAPMVLPRGGGYVTQPGEFHETFANEPTLTFMQKTCVSNIRPAVLCRVGTEPDNSFNRDEALSAGECWDIIEDTMSRRDWPA